MSAAVVLVAAVAENGVIGREGGLPWRLPGDLKHFKAVTIGKPVIMGRKTFASIGKPLPGRPNIVVTRDRAFAAQGVQVARDLVAALAMAEAEADRLGAGEIAVVGGAALFEAALPRAARIEWTEVHAAPPGDVHFPEFDRSRWRERARVGPLRGPGDEFSYSFVTLERR